MLNKLKNLFKKPEPKPHWTAAVETPTEPVIVPVETAKPAPKPRKPRAAKKVTTEPPVSMEKAKATAAGEPYVSILSVDIDPENINAGTFELDWNDKFVKNLIKAGYRMDKADTDNVIVDRWFHTVCRNIVLETYEQEQADPENRDPLVDTRIINRKPLGGGRSEIS